jgi:Zn finger protein HypA/HybF involved in hydrogenase expression
MRKLTKEEFIGKAKEKHDNIYKYDKVDYNGNKIKVKIFCKKCGNYFWQRPNDHLTGHGCPDCGGSKQLITETFIKKAEEKHGNIYGYDKVDYKNAKIRVKIFCKKCGNYFWQRPYNHLTGYGCPDCGGSKQLTTETFIKKAQKVHGNIYKYNKVDYKNNRTKVKIFCKKCGKDFEQEANTHLQGSGCPDCARKESQKKYKYNNIYCDSSWEVLFLMFFCPKAERGPVVKLPSGKDYCIDFRDKDGKLYEVKGTQAENGAYGEDCKNKTKEKLRYCKRHDIMILGKEYFKKYLNNKEIMEKVESCRVDKKSIESHSRYNIGRPVKNLETGREYPTAAAAERETGINRGNIGTACSGKANTAGGYHWIYADKKLSDKEKNNILNKRDKRIKGVICFDTGELFDSIKKAGKHFNVASSSISAVCKGRLKTCGGHTFAYIS